MKNVDFWLSNRSLCRRLLQNFYSMFGYLMSYQLLSVLTSKHLKFVFISRAILLISIPGFLARTQLFVSFFFNVRTLCAKPTSLERSDRDERVSGRPSHIDDGGTSVITRMSTLCADTLASDAPCVISTL